MHRLMHRKNVRILDYKVVSRCENNRFDFLMGKKTHFVLGKGKIDANEDSGIYKEIVLRQHDVPLADLLQPTDT